MSFLNVIVCCLAIRPTKSWWLGPAAGPRFMAGRIRNLASPLRAIERNSNLNDVLRNMRPGKLDVSDAEVKEAEDEYLAVLTPEERKAYEIERDEEAERDKNKIDFEKLSYVEKVFLFIRLMCFDPVLI